MLYVEVECILSWLKMFSKYFQQNWFQGLSYVNALVMIMLKMYFESVSMAKFKVRLSSNGPHVWHAKGYMNSLKR